MQILIMTNLTDKVFKQPSANTIRWQMSEFPRNN